MDEDNSVDSYIELTEIQVFETASTIQYIENKRFIYFDIINSVSEYTFNDEGKGIRCSKLFFSTGQSAIIKEKYSTIKKILIDYEINNINLDLEP